MKIGNPLVQATFSGMAKLTAGSGAGKGVALLSLPVITRIYGPDHLGALAVFIALVVAISPLASFQYHHGIPLPRTDGAAANLAAVCGIFILFTTSVATVVLGSLGTKIFSLLSMETLEPYWWLCSIGVFGLGLSNLVRMWAVRRRAYTRLAFSSFYESVLGNLTKIVLGSLGFKPIGLLLGHLLSYCAGVLSLAHDFVKDLRSRSSAVTFRRMAVVSVHYRDFAIYRTPSQLLSNLAQHLPVVFIAASFGANSAGQFGLAMLALTMPLNLIGRNMGRAFYVETARVGRREAGRIYDALLDLMRYLIIVGVLLAAALYFGAPTLFKLFFGAAWVDAGKFAQVLSVLLALRFVSAPTLAVLSVFRREDVYFQIDLQRFLVVCAVLVIAWRYQLAVPDMLLAYAGTLSIHHAVVIIRIIRLVRAG